MGRADGSGPAAGTVWRMEPQHGRTVVVTGASSGIGAATAAALARAGATVILAVRDVAKGRRMASNMTGDTDVRHLDLSEPASVRQFAANVPGDIDVLINNGGIMGVPYQRTVDGFESQLATNYLGPFALTGLLLPRIRDRVATVSSQAHRQGRIDPDNLTDEPSRYDPSAAYARSKLANLLFAFELHPPLGRGRLHDTQRRGAPGPGPIQSDAPGGRHPTATDHRRGTAPARPVRGRRCPVPPLRRDRGPARRLIRRPARLLPTQRPAQDRHVERRVTRSGHRAQALAEVATAHRRDLRLSGVGSGRA